MGDSITLDMSTAKPLQAAAPVTLDMSSARPFSPDGNINPNPGTNWATARASNPSTIPNPRLRNIQAPSDPSMSDGRAFYEGGKAGLTLGSLPTLVYATPMGLLKGIAGSAVGSIAGKQIAKSAGGGDFPQEVGGDVGGLAGAGVATAGADWAMTKAKTFLSALPEDVQKAIIGLASPRVAHALQLADALGIGKDGVAPDATAENVPYAGASARGRKLPAAQATVPAAASPIQPVAAPQFADRPRVTPSVQNIREDLAQVRNAEAQPNRPTDDSLEDRALQQQMNWDLERHGWAAESEARRRAIAGSSTGVTKSDLTGAVEKPVKYTKTPGVASSGSGAGMTTEEVDDLMGKMQQMLEAARKAKSSSN